MRVALISIYDLENNAVRVLASYLRRRGHRALEVYFKDWKNNAFVWPTEAEVSALVAQLRRSGARLVGFSLRASAYLEVCSFLVERVRRELGLPVLIGGTHATLCPETLADVADYVVRGEAEHAVAELLERLEAGREAHDVANIWTRLPDGTVRDNPVRPLIQDLTQVSHMDYVHPDKVVIDGRSVGTRDPMLEDPIYVSMASRGCPYHCAFCHNSALRQLYRGKGRYWRVRPVQDVLDELHRARRDFRRLQRVRFDDEVFPTDERWLDELCDRYPREIGLPFECFLEPRAVSEPRLRRLVAAGLDVVYMGIQANDRVSTRFYDRQASNDKILEVVRLYHELGIDARVHLMLDDPASTDEDHRALFDLLNAFPRPFRVYLFSLTVMPGTLLACRLLEEGRITPDQVEGAATKTFSQYRVSLDYERPPGELFWASMFVLVNKPGLPRPLLHRVSRSELLRRHPRAVAVAASLSNLAAMAGTVPLSLARGEIPLRVLRRFWNPGQWITA
jgi:radical SAM superfamily enzyme YgiQ (UPF0313 family)